MDDLELLPKVSAYDDRYLRAKREGRNVLFALKKEYSLTDAQLISILAGEIQNMLIPSMSAERRRS